MPTMATIKSYNYRKLSIAYGPNRAHIVSLGLCFKGFDIPWVLVSAMKVSTYRESWSLPWRFRHIVSLGLCHEGFNISWVLVSAMKVSTYRESWSLPWRFQHIVSLGLCHEGFNISWVLVSAMKVSTYRESWSLPWRFRSTLLWAACRYSLGPFLLFVVFLFFCVGFFDDCFCFELLRQIWKTLNRRNLIVCVCGGGGGV